MLGLLSVVTDGLVRDLPGINAVGMPVFARGISPNSPWKNGSGQMFYFSHAPQMELLIHYLDTIRFLMGPVRVAAASAARVCPEVIDEDVAVINLRADNSAMGMVCGNFCAAGFDNLKTLKLVEDAYRLAGL